MIILKKKYHRKQSSVTLTWSGQSLVFLVNTGVGLLAMMSFSLKGNTCFYIFEKPFRKQFVVATSFCLFF